MEFGVHKSTIPDHGPILPCGWSSPCHSIEQDRLTFLDRGETLCAHFTCSMLGFCLLKLVQILCMLSESLWVYMCINPLVSRRCCLLGIIHCLCLLQSSRPQFQNHPWVLKRSQEKLYLDMSTPRSPKLCALSSVGLFVNYHLQ